ncbi:hypothetical protein ACWD4V_00750 [Streptomyces tsukubensis]
MTTHALVGPARAGGISDRAFRLYFHLALQTDGAWISFQSTADACNLSNHQIREPFAELRRVGMAESRRVYETAAGGSKTWRTYVRSQQANGAAA